MRSRIIALRPLRLRRQIVIEEVRISASFALILATSDLSYQTPAPPRSPKGEDLATSLPGQGGLRASSLPDSRRAKNHIPACTLFSIAFYGGLYHRVPQSSTELHRAFYYPLRPLRLSVKGKPTLRPLRLRFMMAVDDWRFKNLSEICSRLPIIRLKPSVLRPPRPLNPLKGKPSAFPLLCIPALSLCALCG